MLLFWANLDQQVLSSEYEYQTAQLSVHPTSDAICHILI
jgi:hypothetical protein